MFKKFIILSLMLILTNCGVTGTALLGPSITGARTGSVYQASLSYGSTHVIKKTKESIEKIKKTKKIIYQKADQMNKKVDQLNKVVLKNQADIFFKAVKNNLKKHN